MGQLTNLYVSESYQGLLKLANSTTGVTGTLQYVQDGLGNNIPMLVSTSSVVITGSFRGDGSGLTGITATVDSGSLVTTASFNAYTSSNDNRVNSLIASTGSYATTSSLTALSQSIASTDLAQNNRLTAIESITGSLATTGSLNSYTLTSSFNAYTSSANGRLSSLESATASLQNQINQKLDTGSFNTYTSSNDSKVNSLIAATSSYITSAQTSSMSVANAVSASQAQNANTASFALNGGVTQILAGPNIIVSPLSGIGQVTISSTGTGTGSFNTATGSYGSFYDTTTQTNPVANTPNSMSFNNTAITNGVSISGSISPFNTYIKTVDAGTYNIQFSAQVDKTDGGSDDIDIWIRKNGIDLVDTGTKLTLPSNNSKVVAAWNWFVQSAANDYYQLIWSSADTNMRLFAEPSSSAHPGIPSVIATANRVDQFLSNTGSFTGSFIGSFTGSLQGTASFASNFDKTGLITTGSISTTQAITGSVIISGSQQIIRGNVDLSGSMNIRNGNFEVISDNTTLNPDFYLTSSQAGQSNMVFGWGDNPQSGPGAVQANYTGSLRITGSNNIVNLPQIRATAFGGGADQQGYISGSNNWINSNLAGIFLNTGSLLFPKIQNNILGLNSVIGMNFTTSSLAGGHPILSNNLILGGQATINSNSGSIGSFAQNALLGGGITSNQNFVTNTRPTISSNNVIGSVTLNHISSSINYQNNYNNSPVTINNHLSSSNITNNNFNFTSNAVFGGSTNTGLGVWISGSQSSNASRQVIDNLIGGKNIIVSSSFVSSSASNLVASLVYGQGLSISGNHSGNIGGTAFLGRFNDTGSLGIAQDIVFAVGTGTAAATRRTGLYVTSGSLVGVSGSLDVKGNSTLTGSVNILGETVMSSSLAAGVPLYVSGTIQTQRMQYDGNPFNSNPSSNLAALRYDSNNQAFSITNYNKADLSSGSIVELFINTGSNFVHTKQFANYANTSAVTTLSNSNGVRNFDVNTDTTTITGSLRVTGSAIITGSVQGNVIPLTVASNTASLNLNNGNFFELALTGSQDIRIEPSNIKPGQTINIKLNTTGSGTVSFPTSVKQVSGSAYVPTSGTSTDIITMVSFDSTNLFLANVKNLI